MRITRSFTLVYKHALWSFSFLLPNEHRADGFLTRCSDRSWRCCWGGGRRWGMLCQRWGSVPRRMCWVGGDSWNWLKPCDSAWSHIGLFAADCIGEVWKPPVAFGQPVESYFSCTNTLEKNIYHCFYCLILYTKCPRCSYFITHWSTWMEYFRQRTHKAATGSGFYYWFLSNCCSKQHFLMSKIKI